MSQEEITAEWTATNIDDAPEPNLELESKPEIASMWYRIRYIMCSEPDAAVARSEIEQEIGKAALALGLPALAVETTRIEELLGLPLRDRIERLRDDEHPMPQWL